MTWLSENWIWLALIVGALLLITRMHGMGCGAGHRHASHGPAGAGHGTGPQSPESRSVNAVPGSPAAGLPHGGHGCCH